MSKSKTAIDIQFNELTKSFDLVTVNYDLETKEAKIESVEPIADSKHVALHKGKEILVKKMFGLA